MRIFSHYSSCEVQPEVVYADRHCRLPLSVVNNLLLGNPSTHFEEMKCYLQLRLPNCTTHCFFIHQDEHIARVATSHCMLTQNVDRTLLCLDNSQLQSIRDGAFPKPQLCCVGEVLLRPSQHRIRTCLVANQAFECVRRTTMKLPTVFGSRSSSLIIFRDFKSYEAGAGASKEEYLHHIFSGCSFLNSSNSPIGRSLSQQT
jgi:hypothetical protein